MAMGSTSSDVTGCPPSRTRTTSATSGPSRTHGAPRPRPLTACRRSRSAGAGSCTPTAEEAEQTVGDLYVPHRLSARDALDARLNVAPFERITFGYLAYGAPVSLRVPPLVDSFHPNLTLRGTTRVRHGCGEVRTAALRSGVLLSTEAGSTVDWSADAARFAMKLPRPTLEAQLAALLHDTPPGPLVVDLGVDLTTPAGRGVLAAAEFLAAQLGVPVRTCTPTGCAPSWSPTS